MPEYVTMSVGLRSLLQTFSILPSASMALVRLLCRSSRTLLMLCARNVLDGAVFFLSLLLFLFRGLDVEDAGLDLIHHFSLSDQLLLVHGFTFMLDVAISGFGVRVAKELPYQLEATVLCKHLSRLGHPEVVRLHARISVLG